MNRIRRWGVLAGVLGAGWLVAIELRGADGPQAETAPTAAQLEFFEKKIRPVLAEHCYQCHSAAAEKANQLKGGLRVDNRAGLRQGGDSGPAVTPGKPDESQLLAALKFESVEMPPKGKLPAAVIADFETWIREGASDPRTEGGGAKRATIDVEAGRKFWAYAPLRDAPPPTVARRDLPRGAIDAWLAATLEARGLEPAPEADRETFVRRLFFDLVGLPPEPDDVAEFAADSSPDAVERLVDRLLASPRFGERWGRHWLDVVRFAESITLRGFILPEAWRYRDYVIESFNRDRPFDQFVAEQVAGDLLPADSLDERRRRLVATTFLALGNTNLEEQDKGQLRMDVVDEQLEVIGKGVLGQTLGCARCHDHKFDPIPTRDYYALAGILRSTRTLEHANVSKWLEFPLPVEPEREAVYREHESRVAVLQKQVKEAKDAAKLAATGKKSDPAAPAIVEPKSLAGIVVDDAQAKQVGAWKHSQFSRRYVGDGYLHDEDKGKGEKTLTFVPELPKGGRYEVRFAYTPGGNRSAKVPVTVFSADGEKTVHVNEQDAPPIDGRFISLGQYRFEANGQGFVIVANEGTEGHVIVDAVQFLPVEPAAAPAKETPSGKSAATGGKDAKDSSPAEDASARAEARVKELETELKRLVDGGPKRPMFMSVEEEKKPEDARIHVRGLVGNQGDVVPRGFLQVASVGPPPQIASGESGRRELGAWLGLQANPLSSRVFANRVWHWMFGAGLVRTCDNFGATGELPSHPELLDALALRFRRQDGSTKDLVRQIATSRAYRTDSSASAAATAADPENRWLAHANRRRLDAECLLDALLAASGQLRLEIGGPVLKPGLAADYGYEHRTTRRAVYWPLLRNSLPEMLEAFDLADPSLVTGRRNTSTVAPQALFLMNDPFVLEQARAIARRIAADGGDDDQRRLEVAYRRLLGRKPTDKERTAAANYLAAVRAPDSPDAAGRRDDAWTQLVQTLVATVDFRYVE